MKRNTKQALAMAMAFVTGFSTIPINTSATAHITANNEGVVTLPLGDEDYADEDAGISNLPLGDEDYEEGNGSHNGIAPPHEELDPDFSIDSDENLGDIVVDPSFTIPADEENAENSSTMNINTMVQELATNGGLTVSGTAGTDYSYDSSTKTLTVKKSVTIQNVDINTASDTKIVLDTTSSFTTTTEPINITLNGVNIKCTNGIALEIPASYTGTATITLADGTVNKLVGATNGLKNSITDSNNKVTISGEIGEGTLVTYATQNGEKNATNKGIDGTIELGNNVKLATNSMGTGITIATVSTSNVRTHVPAVILEGLTLNSTQNNQDTFKTTDTFTLREGVGKVEFTDGSGIFTPENFRVTVEKKASAKIYSNINKSNINVIDGTNDTETGNLSNLPAGGYIEVRKEKFAKNDKLPQNLFVISKGTTSTVTGTEDKLTVKRKGSTNSEKALEVISGEGIFTKNLDYGAFKNAEIKFGEIPLQLTEGNQILFGIISNFLWTNGTIKSGDLIWNPNGGYGWSFVNSTTSKYESSKSFVKGVLSGIADGSANGTNILTTKGMVIENTNKYYQVDTNNPNNPEVSYSMTKPSTSRDMKNTSTTPEKKIFIDFEGNLHIPPGATVQSGTVSVTIPENHIKWLKIPKGYHFRVTTEANKIYLPPNSSTLEYSNNNENPRETKFTNGFTYDITNNSNVIDKNQSDFKITGGTNNTDYEFKNGDLHIKSGTIELSKKENATNPIYEDIYIEGQNNQTSRTSQLVLTLKDVDFMGNIYVNADTKDEEIKIILDNANLKNGGITIKENSKSNVTVQIKDGTTNSMRHIHKDGFDESAGTLKITGGTATTSSEKGLLNMHQVLTNFWAKGTAVIGTSTEGKKTRNITIDGGKIDGYMPSNAALIGGSKYSDVKNIRVEGTAEIIVSKNAYWGIGIGAGAYSDVEDIYIGGNSYVDMRYGGSITSQSMTFGAIGVTAYTGEKGLKNIHITDNAVVYVEGTSGAIGTNEGYVDGIKIDGNSYVNARTIKDTSGTQTGSSIVISVAIGTSNRESKNLSIKGNALVNVYAWPDSQYGAISVGTNSEVSENAVIQIVSDGTRQLEDLIRGIPQSARKGGMFMYLKENLRYGNRNFELRGMTIEDGNALVQTTQYPVLLKQGETVKFAKGSYYITNNKEFKFDGEGTLQPDGSVNLEQGVAFTTGATTVTPPETGTINILKNGYVKVPNGSTIKTGLVNVKTTAEISTFFKDDGSYDIVEGMKFVFNNDTKEIALPQGSTVNVNDSVTVLRNSSFILDDTTNKLKITLPVRYTGTIAMTTNGMSKLTLPGGTVIAETTVKNANKSFTIDATKVKSVTFEDKATRLNTTGDNYWHTQLKIEQTDNTNIGNLVILDGTEVVYTDTSKGTQIAPVGGWLVKDSMEITWPTSLVTQGDFIVMGSSNLYEYNQSDKTLKVKGSGLSLVNKNPNAPTETQIIIEPTAVSGGKTTTGNTLELNLHGININTNNKAPIEVNANGKDVILIVANGSKNILTSGTSAGIDVKAGNKLVIKCENDTIVASDETPVDIHACSNIDGELYVTGGTNKSGIDSQAPIEIKGSTIHLKGNGTANALKSTSTINISGGNVYADSETNVDSISATTLTINTDGFVRASKLATATRTNTFTKGLIFNGIEGTAYGNLKILTDLELPTTTDTEKVTIKKYPKTQANGNQKPTYYDVTFGNSQNPIAITFNENKNNGKTSSSTQKTLMYLLNGGELTIVDTSTNQAIIETTGSVTTGEGVQERKITAPNGNSIKFVDNNTILVPRGSTITANGNKSQLKEAGIQLPLRGNETINVTYQGVEIPLGSKAIIGSTELLFKDGGNGYLGSNMTITLPAGLTATSKTGVYSQDVNENTQKDTTLNIPRNGTLRLEMRNFPTAVDNSPIAMLSTGGTLTRDGEDVVTVLKGEIGITPDGTYAVPSGSEFKFKDVKYGYTGVLPSDSVTEKPETRSASLNSELSWMAWDAKDNLNVNGGKLHVGANDLEGVTGDIPRQTKPTSILLSELNDIPLTTTKVNGLDVENVLVNVNNKGESILKLENDVAVTAGTVTYTPQKGQSLFFTAEGDLASPTSSTVKIGSEETEVTLPTSIYLPKGKYGDLQLDAEKTNFILPEGSKYENKTGNVVLELPKGGTLAVNGATVTPIDFIPVENISISMPTEVSVNAKIPVLTTIAPNNATYKTIVWSITTTVGEKTTNASITDGIFTATSAGTYKVTATITDGKAVGTSATQEHTITVKNPKIITINTGINGTVMAEQNTISSDNTVLVPENGSQKFIITANDGYEIDTVTVTDTPASISSEKTDTDLSGEKTGEYTISSIVTDKTLTVTFKKSFVPVTKIDLVQGSTMLQTDTFNLQGKITPQNATNQTITWELTDKGTTEAELTNGILTVTNQGTLKVTATVINGSAQGTNYTQEFTIKVVGKTYEITTSAYSGGKILSATRFNRSKFVEDKVVSVPESSDAKFIIQADNGYRIESLTLDGIDVTNQIQSGKNQGLKSGTYTIQNVKTGHILTVKFKKLPGTEVIGKASFGAGKLPSVIALTSETGLTIENTVTKEGKIEDGYTISRTLTDKTENTPASVTFAITKTGEKRPAIAVTLNAKDVTTDLSNVGITLKATANSKEFDFTLTGVVEDNYDIITYKKNHTYATYKDVNVKSNDDNNKVDITSTKMEMLAGDLNGDGSVDVTDYGALMSNYDSVSAEYDIDDIGKVDITDYGALMGNYDAKANIYPKASN